MTIAILISLVNSKLKIHQLYRNWYMPRPGTRSGTHHVLVRIRCTYWYASMHLLVCVKCMYWHATDAGMGKYQMYVLVRVRCMYWNVSDARIGTWCHRQARRGLVSGPRCHLDCRTHQMRRRPSLWNTLYFSYEDKFESAIIRKKM